MTPQDLTTIRESLGLNKNQLAKKLGVTAGAITFWESGKRKIPKPVILLLALLKGIDGHKEKGDNA